MANKEITNEDIMREIKNLRSEINTIRQMIYETNIDFFDTKQIANFDNRYPFEIRPLTNRELILYAMNRYPVVDSATRREKLLTKKEMIEAGTPEELVKHNFEITQEKLEEIFNQPPLTTQNEYCIIMEK